MSCQLYSWRWLLWTASPDSPEGCAPLQLLLCNIAKYQSNPSPIQHSCTDRTIAWTTKTRKLQQYCPTPPTLIFSEDYKKRRQQLCIQQQIQVMRTVHNASTTTHSPCTSLTDGNKRKNSIYGLLPKLKALQVCIVNLLYLREWYNVWQYFTEGDPNVNGGSKLAINSCLSIGLPSGYALPFSITSR